MSPLRFSIGAFVFLAFGAAAACSSSSSNNGPEKGDGGSDDGTTSGGDEASNPLGINATCGILSALGGGGSTSMCPKGMTCCTMLALPPSASCVAVGSCSGISTECSSAADCAAGQVCCTGSADAAAFSLDAAVGAAGAGGIPMIDPSALSSTCQSSCAGTQTQQCAMDSECPSGQTCQGFGGAGAAGGEAGAAAGGLGGGLGGNFMLPKTCMAPRPDAGNPPPMEDAGSTEDTGTPPPTPDADMPDVAAE